MKKNGMYCPECRQLISIIPKQDRDFDEVACPYEGCDGVWVNKEPGLVQSQKPGVEDKKDE